MNNEEKAVQTTWLSVLSNFILALIKGLAGFFGNSYALIADAIESLTDTLSSFLVLLGFHYAKRPADDNHPYGHGKIEPLMAIAVAILLISSAILIAY